MRVGQRSSSSPRLRAELDTEGFRAALDKGHAKYQIVAEQATNWTPDQGESVCQNFLTAHPDLDLISSHVDDMTIGCARAIDAAKSKVKLIATGGGSKLGHDAILAGEIYGSVCTRPKLLGALMFQAMYDAVTKPGTAKGRFIGYDMPRRGARARRQDSDSAADAEGRDRSQPNGHWLLRHVHALRRGSRPRRPQILHRQCRERLRYVGNLANEAKVLNLMGSAARAVLHAG